MTERPSDSLSTRFPRLAILDVARGLAVVAMAIYHFSWDLSWFGFVDWSVSQGQGWRIFAACIAGSFLFLAGISLDLAHHQGIKWRSFWKREAIIIAAAVVVSAVTFFTFGDSFVRFGILHSIAAASLIALPFSRLPLATTVAAAAIFLSMPMWASAPFFDGPLWLWTGLGNTGHASVDYVPVAPWASVTLMGVAVSSFARKFDLWPKLSVFRFDGLAGKISRWLGRHSLPIYLLHQPVLYGLVSLAASFGTGADRAGISFIQSCTQNCQATWNTPEVCKAACTCTLTHLKVDGIWLQLTQEPENMSLRTQMNNHHALCLADSER
ncbi:MAG: heparan-alpha-glucosaminide N-acetyltransferase [Roseibium sp.]